MSLGFNSRFADNATVKRMWTTGGYAQQLVKRHLLEIALAPELLPGTDLEIPNIVEPHKDKLTMSFLTQKKSTDAHAGFLGIAISFPVKMPVYSGRVEKLTSRWEKWLGLPYSRWTIGKSKVRGCSMLYLFFGMQRSHLDEAEEQE